MPITSKLGSSILGNSIESSEITNDEIVNADINSAAAIALSKLAATTASRALVSDGSGVISPATTTATEIGYVNGVTSAIQTQLDAKQPLDSDLTALAGQTGTNTFPVRTGAGTISEVAYSAGTFTPTVTLVGGSGNTVPVYDANLGYYVKVGSTVWVDIFLAGDGGAEGAGTGQVNIALPFAASSAYVSTYGALFCGAAGNSSSAYILGIIIDTSATTISLGYLSTISTPAPFTGDLQNDTSRNIRLQFVYRVD